MIDPYKTMKFYDPLYRVITIKPEEVQSFGMRKYWAPSLEGVENGLIENIVTKVISCREMARLNFLRQSGPAFLAFPSSTHTRFAHSLGTYYLGLESLERCWVEKTGRKMQLSTFIDNLGWRDEYLLSLLLHDTGHLPFSHVIEQNHNLKTKPPKHEDIAASHIMGGIESSWFTEYLFDKFGVENSLQISKLIDIISKEAKVQIDKGLISYFITQNNTFLNGKQHLKEAQMVKDMVSGLLDLDRFDHYYRDSFFMGNMLTRFNVPSFLDDFILTDHGCKLKGDGIAQVLSFLQSKENMVKFSFENTENLSYESMLNFCIALYDEKYLEAKGSREYKKFRNQFIFWTDDELLFNLLSSNILELNNLIYRIMYKKPYICLCKFTASTEKVGRVEDIRKIRKNIIDNSKGKIKEFQLLLRIPRKFGISIDPKGEWLSMQSMMDAEGNKLVMTNRSIEREVQHALSEQARGEPDFWIFVDDELKKSVRDSIGEQFEKMTGCANVLNR